MVNHTNTENTVYDITNPLYWDKSSLYSEMDRVYDICIGCRLCFNLCPSFPSLFNSIDNAGERKRDVAENQGIVEKKIEKKEYLDLPEGPGLGVSVNEELLNRYPYVQLPMSERGI